MAALEYPQPPLQDDRIVLLPPAVSDIPQVVAACQEPSISEYSPSIPRPYGPGDAVNWFASHEPARLAGTSLSFVVKPIGIDRLLGVISTDNVDLVQGRTQIGYWLIPEARGHGYMTTAARLVCGWLFNDLGLARVELTNDPENVASQRLAARVGFKHEGHLRSHQLIRHSGKRRDSLIWGLLPDELV